MSYNCPICDRPCETKQDFIKHVKNSHSRKEIKKAYKRMRKR